MGTYLKNKAIYEYQDIEILEKLENKIIVVKVKTNKGNTLIIGVDKYLNEIGYINFDNEQQKSDYNNFLKWLKEYDN